MGKKFEAFKYDFPGNRLIFKIVSFRAHILIVYQEVSGLVLDKYRALKAALQAC